jgi:hypothetical protein
VRLADGFPILPGMSLVGERKAIAASVLIFFSFLFLLGAFSSPPMYTRMFLSLASVYGLGFFSVVAGYFWARWYAIGVGLFGALLAGMGIWQAGPEPIFLFLGGAHLAVMLTMMGDAMQAPFEGKPEWRARFHMDEHGVNRLGRSVVRAAMGLPIVLLYAFAPKQDSALVLATALLAAGGFSGLVRLRSWGVLALGGAALTATLAAATGAVMFLPAALLLAGAVVPFVQPFARALRAS